MSNPDTVTIWTKDSVIALLRRNDKAVVAAIKNLNARQTDSERASGTAIVTNGRGFNKQDAKFLCDIARKLPRHNDHMTDRQLYVARLKLTKYWRQLLEIIEEKGGQVAFPKGTKRACEPSPEIDKAPDMDVAGEEDMESDFAPATLVASDMPINVDNWNI